MGVKGALATKPIYRPTFYGILALATLAGLGLDFFGDDPIRALFSTAVINGMVAPPLMVLIMLIANHKGVLGDRVNNAWTNVLGWLATILMFAAAVGLVLTWGH